MGMNAGDDDGHEDTDSMSGTSQVPRIGGARGHSMGLSDSIDFDESCLPNSCMSWTQLLIMIIFAVGVLITAVRIVGLTKHDVDAFKHHTISELQELQNTLIVWNGTRIVESRGGSELDPLSRCKDRKESLPECDEARWYYGVNDTALIPLEYVQKPSFRQGFRPLDPTPGARSSSSAQHIASTSSEILKAAALASGREKCPAPQIVDLPVGEDLPATYWRCAEGFSSGPDLPQSHEELKGLPDRTCEFHNVYVKGGRLYALKHSASELAQNLDRWQTASKLTSVTFPSAGTATTPVLDPASPERRVQSSQLPDSLWYGYDPIAKSGVLLKTTVQSVSKNEFQAEIKRADISKLTRIPGPQVLVNNRLPYFLDLNIPDYAFSTHAYVDLLLPAWFASWRLGLSSSCNQVLIPLFENAAYNMDGMSKLTSRTDTAGEAMWPLVFGPNPTASPDEKLVHSIARLCRSQQGTKNDDASGELETEGPAQAEELCLIERLVVYSPSYGFYHHHAPVDISWKAEALAALSSYLRFRMPELSAESIGNVPYAHFFRLFNIRAATFEPGQLRSQSHGLNYPSTTGFQLLEQFVQKHMPTLNSSHAMEMRQTSAFRIVVFARTVDESEKSMHCRGCCAANHAQLVQALERSFADAEVATVVSRHTSFLQQAREIATATIAISVDGGALELASVMARTNTGIVVVGRRPKLVKGDSGGEAVFNHDGEDSAYLDLWATRLHVRKLMPRPARVASTDICKLDYDIPLVLEAVRDILLFMHFHPKREGSWLTRGRLHRQRTKSLPQRVSDFDPAQNATRYPLGPYGVPNILESIRDSFDGRGRLPSASEAEIPSIFDSPGIEYHQALA